MASGVWWGGSRFGGREAFEVVCPTKLNGSSISLLGCCWYELGADLVW